MIVAKALPFASVGSRPNVIASNTIVIEEKGVNDSPMAEIVDPAETPEGVTRKVAGLEGVGGGPRVGTAVTVGISTSL